MQYYKKPQNSEINVLFKSIERFMECIDNLDEFRVLGGDPFMNKELYKIINKLVSQILKLLKPDPDLLARDINHQLAMEPLGPFNKHVMTVVPLQEDMLEMDLR